MAKNLRKDKLSMPTITPNTSEKKEEEVEMIVLEDTEVSDKLILKALEW